MKAPEIFTSSSGYGGETFRVIAERLDCHEYLISGAFSGNFYPEWDAREHINAIKMNTEAQNDAARHAKNLLRAMRRLSDEVVANLIHAGAPTFAQIEFLKDVLSADVTSLKNWAKERPTAGGRNPGAKAYPLDAGVATSCEAQPPGRRRTFVAGTCE